MRSIGIGRSAGCDDTRGLHLTLDRESGRATVSMIERIVPDRLPPRCSQRDDMAADLSGEEDPR